MKKENLLNRWLDHSLSDDEREALKNDERFRAYETITQAAQYFRAPEINTTSSYDRLLISKNKAKVKRLSWPKIAASIAAILVLGFLVNNLIFSNQINYKTGIGETLALVLPDKSTVDLSAGTTLSYNKNTWDEQREVVLNGEAYFKVAPGTSFTVNTPFGKVQVTGTAFNVVNHTDYFVVSCFEGSLLVSSEVDKTFKLTAGDEFRMIGDKLTVTKTANLKPAWILKKSIFKSTPLYIILEDLQRHYDVNISTKNIDKSIIFTGSFTHEDLETAIQAISIPLGLEYTLQDSNVLLENND